jgi:hypothetical protein
MTKEVYRTAFEYIESHQNGLGKGLPHGINQVCIACKAGGLVDGKPVGSVEKITDITELKHWADFYKTKEFTAYKCNCGYKWSWYKPY